VRIYKYFLGPLQKVFGSRGNIQTMRATRKNRLQVLVTS